VIDFTTEPLTDHFAAGSVDHILANDIIEHLFHWEAVNLLQQFHELLRPGGTVEIRVPDCEWVLRSRLSVEDKLWHFYGGQDVPQGRDEAMDKAREKYPQYFCHKYGWTMDRMQAELVRIGFLDVQARRANTNFVTYAVRY
jgi:predicted SAM-dependent methyltransferase